MKSIINYLEHFILLNLKLIHRTPSKSPKAIGIPLKLSLSFKIKLIWEISYISLILVTDPQILSSKARPSLFPTANELILIFRNYLFLQTQRKKKSIATPILNILSIAYCIPRILRKTSNNFTKLSLD